MKVPVNFWFVLAPSDGDLPPMPDVPAPKLTVWQRISAAINNNPIGALILATGVISVVLFTLVKQASDNANNAATRIEAVARDIGELKASTNFIQKEVAKIEDIRSAVNLIYAFNQAFDQQLRAIKPYEIRLIESFGVRVDDNLRIEVNNGQILVFPLTPTKRGELKDKGFSETTSFITNPVRATGWLLPVIPVSLVQPRQNR